jgi:transcriptional regulator with XRE-family HTH domain
MAAIVAVNIRTLRQRNGWTQAELGALMGWPNASTVCAAEGRRGGRQRAFTAREVRQLAAIFGVPSGQLTAPAWHAEPLIPVDAETGARRGLRVR